MENHNLLKDELVIETSQKKITVSQNVFRIQNILVLTIFFMQIFIISYLLILSKYARELNLFNFNKTETQEYLSKFKIIIDNVCVSFVNCSP